MIRNLAATLLSILICLGLMELGLRLYDKANGRSFFNTARIVPHRIFGIQPGRSEGGELGIVATYGKPFPFEKPENTIRIVTFGGSTSVNAAVYRQHGFNYSSRLEDDLNERFDNYDFEVINVANEAYATPHSLTLLAFDALSWDPDIVILSHNVNDLHASFFPDFVPDYANKYADPYYSMTWFRQSCLNLRLCRMIRSRIEQSKLFIHPPRRKSFGAEPAPLVQEVFARNLRSFATLATSAGIQVIFGSQPLKDLTEQEFDEDINVKPYNDHIYYPLHEEFIRHHGRFNANIENVAGEMDVAYADNHEIFDGNSDYFLDLVHYSKAGVELLAQNYGKVVASLLEDELHLNVSQASGRDQPAAR
jgi:hypothetical protein